MAPSRRIARGDPTTTLYVTEGAEEADALAAMGASARSASAASGAWRGKTRYGGKVTIPDWEVVALNQRPVRVVFDTDATQKPAVRALLRLKHVLERRGAIVESVEVQHHARLLGEERVAREDP